MRCQEEMRMRKSGGGKINKKEMKRKKSAFQSQVPQLQLRQLRQQKSALRFNGDILWCYFWVHQKGLLLCKCVNAFVCEDECVEVVIGGGGRSDNEEKERKNEIKRLEMKIKNPFLLV